MVGMQKLKEEVGPPLPLQKDSNRNLQSEPLLGRFQEPWLRLRFAAEGAGWEGGNLAKREVPVDFGSAGNRLH